MALTIESTSNYDTFRFHKMQRALDPNHVARIQKSMKKRGFIPTSHIIVTPDMEIIDGQHRFQAAKNLEIDIYYAVQGDLDVDDVREMAATTVGWKIDDFVTSFIRQGREDYARLRALRVKSGLSWESVLHLLGDLKSTKRALISGKYYFTEIGEQRFANFFEKFQLFKDAFPQGWYHRHFVIACAHVFSHPRYDHEQMVKRIGYQTKRLVKCHDAATYVRLLEEIYNFNSRADNIVDFEYRRRKVA